MVPRFRVVFAPLTFRSLIKVTLSPSFNSVPLLSRCSIFNFQFWFESRYTKIELKFEEIVRGGFYFGRIPPLTSLDFWYYIFGIITASITWITPLSATMSAFVTLALSTITPFMASMVTSVPCTVFAMVFLPAISAAITLPGTT